MSSNNFYLAKKVLKYCNRHSCTPDMLYLVDKSQLFSSIEDLEDYHGEITSCVILIGSMDGKLYKRSRKLINKYSMTPTLVHKCMAIYMGEVGNIDYTYKDKFPEAKNTITQIGNLIREYYLEVTKFKKLYKLINNISEIPNYTTDVVTLVCELSEKINLVSFFEEISSPLDMIMEVNKENIRRKISVDYLPKNITKRYIRPSTLVKSNYILGRLKKKDFLFYSNFFSFVRGKNSTEASSNQLINTMVEILQKVHEDITMVGKQEVDSRVCFEYDHDVWHKRVMAFIVTTYKPYKNITSLVKEVDFDVPYNGPEKELLIVSINILNTKCTFKSKSVTISNSKDELSTIYSVAIAMGLISLYESLFDEVYEYLASNTTEEKICHNLGKVEQKEIKLGRKSKIDELRKKLPELFVRNYTRECHRLPILLENKKEATEYRKLGRLVIKYPLEGKYSRYYSSPSNDLYVGLKTNRLSNKSTFKYIVVCYTANHLLNPSKKTYQYYVNNDKQPNDKYKKDIKTLKALSIGRHGPIPRVMEAEYGIYNYKRLGTGGSFLECLESALDINIDINELLSNNPNLINILRQELWNVPDELIIEQLSSENIDGTIYYRLFEEVYKHNIIIVEVNHQGKYKLSLPPYKSYYIWEPCKYRNYVVILKNIRKLYHDVSISYELIVRDINDTCVFTIDDDLVSKLVNTKRLCTLPPSDDWATLPTKKKIRKQYIDEEGKCVLLFLKDNSIVECGTRPYSCEVIGKEEVLLSCSRLYNHLLEVNKLRSVENRWLSTTSDYLYFPDNASFIYWMDV